MNRRRWIAIIGISGVIIVGLITVWIFSSDPLAVTCKDLNSQTNIKSQSESKLFLAASAMSAEVRHQDGSNVSPGEAQVWIAGICSVQENENSTIKELLRISFNRGN